MTTDIEQLVMRQPLLLLVALFFAINMLANFSTWRGESEFPSLNQRTIREYRYKTLRDALMLLAIAAALFYA